MNEARGYVYLTLKAGVCLWSWMGDINCGGEEIRPKTVRLEAVAESLTVLWTSSSERFAITSSSSFIGIHQPGIDLIHKDGFTFFDTYMRVLYNKLCVYTENQPL